MKQARRAFVLAVLLAAPLAGAAEGRAQQAAPRAWNTFTERFDSAAAAGRVVGGAAVLVRDGRVVARHAYGLADREKRQRVDERTLFHYGSITKTLTAIAIMQLRDRGLLSLDDRVTTYLPELRQVHDAYGAMDDVTIRMLLSHSAGFQNPTWPYRRGRDWEPFEPTRWEQLVAMMPYQELHFAPGSRYGYSNPAYIYLARIVEQLTGDPWQSYVQKNLFAPLGMSRSYFGATPYYLAADRANSYTVERDSGGRGSGGRGSGGRDTLVAFGREFDPGITIPNGGWNAPLEDLATYAAFLTNATGGDSAKARRYATVLKRSSLEEMWRPVVDVPAGDLSGDSMGLGFFLWSGASASAAPGLVGHTGEQAGFLSALYLNPRTATAIIYSVNTIDETDRAATDARWAALLQEALRVLR